MSTRQTLTDATASSSSDPLLGYPQIATPPDEWRRENPKSRRSKIQPLRFMAEKAAAYDLRVISTEYLSRRKGALRKLDICKWARIVKPAMRVSHGFTTSWYTPTDGPSRRPASAKEACEGARQELS